MKLLPNEKQVLSHYGITLTTHRVYSGDNSSDFTSIFLEKITAVQAKLFHRPILLMLGIIMVFMGIIFGSSSKANSLERLIERNPFFLLAIVGGGILILIYAMTRTQNLSIQSASSSIEVDIAGVNREKLFELIDRVEEAKNARYLGSLLDIEEVEPMQVIESKCSKCGEKYTKGDNFCEKCGNKI